MKLFYLIFIVFLAFVITEGKDPRCNLPIDAGLCFGNMNRFAFDMASQKCISFVYGGCQGNENRFDSVEECQSIC